MTAHLKYLRYLLRHKWFVLVAGLRTRAPLWRLLIHDWSKFTPAEWGPYVATFYGDRCQIGSGYRVEIEYLRLTDLAYDRAWLHHQHANPHHWQHWILRHDDGSIATLPMPEHFVSEMVADWMGAGRAITGRWEAWEWYCRNSAKMLLATETRRLAESLLREHAATQQPTSSAP